MKSFLAWTLAALAAAAIPNRTEAAAYIDGVQQVRLTAVCAGVLDIAGNLSWSSEAKAIQMMQ